MNNTRRWYTELNSELKAAVHELVGDDPSDEQIGELVDLAEAFALEGMDIDEALRQQLATAIDTLSEQLAADDPRHRFLRDNEGTELAARLLAFYQSGEHAQYQNAALKDTEYASYPLYVDFDGIAMLMNPDFTAETIGEQYVEFANLTEQPDGDPDSCYAHLAIHPNKTTIYLMEPSGDPELIADDLETFLSRLEQ